MPSRSSNASSGANDRGDNVGQKNKKKKQKANAETSTPSTAIAEFNYKTASSSSNAANFGTMAKIVDYMRKRHLNQQYWSLSLHDILEEIAVYGLERRAETWLVESLPNNPRLAVDADGKFSFRPPYKVKGKTSLLALLKRCDTDGKGGVLHSELAECTANIEAIVRSLGDQVMEIGTQINKRKDRVYFFSDPSTVFRPDDEFKSLWRGVSVDHLDEKKIEEYLVKHGIDSMKDLAPKRVNFGPPKRKAVKRKMNSKVHNEHLNDVLEDYVMD